MNSTAPDAWTHFPADITGFDFVVDAWLFATVLAEDDDDLTAAYSALLGQYLAPGGQLLVVFGPCNNDGNLNVSSATLDRAVAAVRAGGLDVVLSDTYQGLLAVPDHAVPMYQEQQVGAFVCVWMLQCPPPSLFLFPPIHARTHHTLPTIPLAAPAARPRRPPCIHNRPHARWCVGTAAPGRRGVVAAGLASPERPLHAVPGRRG